MPITVGSTVDVAWVPDWSATGSSASLTVTAPDGTQPTPPTVSPGLTPGTFTAELAVALPGRYVLRWEDDTEHRVSVDILDVWPEDPRYLISVDDAAVGLKWRPADRAAHIATLALYVAAATEVLEDITGAILVRTIVQPADGGRSGVALWERPSAIVSVVVEGEPWTGFVPNLNAAIVYGDGNGGRFPSGRQNVIITYRTGSETVAPSIQLAARELIRHLWQVGQQALESEAQPIAPNGQTVMTRSGFAVPNRVIELCGNQHALPGIA